MKVTVALTASTIFLFVLSLSFVSGRSQAQTQTGTSDSLTTEAARMDRMAGTLGDGKVVDKLSADFSSFLGADAKAVVAGLRNGTPITLTTTTPGATPGRAPYNNSASAVTKAAPILPPDLFVVEASR